ncbi:MAG TPA: AAA family ATPase [Steroidobacteraceae bacterium]|nr:AAA family ATPase [Steroidobacteraceae bacterium]
MSPGRSIAERLEAASFPHPVERLELRETAISWLVLTGAYVYKIKKPLHLDYLDASTLERRHFLCGEELRLNRRFAPALYLEVVPISESQGRLAIGVAGPAVEYAVRMRQFAQSDELAQCLGDGAVTSEEMARFGTQLGEWHETAATAPDPSYGSVALVSSQVLRNFSSSKESGPASEPQLARLEAWSREQLNALRSLIEKRRRDGRVRECHGDLHAANLVRWEDAWLPFDCLEFEPRLRWIDVVSDVAFLFMDLLSRQRAELAFAFLSAWLERTGDYDALPLLRFYAVYRALVRAKVDALRDEQQRRQQRIATAGALAHDSSAALLLMHGVSASGKSWLSTRLIPALTAVRVRSDLERRRLYGSGAHSVAADDVTYRRLYDCAQSALASGLRIIVDATFLQAARQRPFLQLSRATGCPLLMIDCQAPTEVLEARISARSREAHDPSEADLAVLRRQLAQAEPLEPQPDGSLIQAETTSPSALASVVKQARAQLPD